MLSGVIGCDGVCGVHGALVRRAHVSGEKPREKAAMKAQRPPTASAAAACGDGAKLEEARTKSERKRPAAEARSIGLLPRRSKSCEASSRKMSLHMPMPMMASSVRLSEATPVARTTSGL